MAELKFTCPHCNQHITCDELWGGHELQCPGCQNNILVPAPAAPASAQTSGSSLVPAPPKGGVAALGISKPQAHATGGAHAVATPSKPVIRNLAPAIQKKKNPVAKIAAGAAITVALAVGGYYGFLWVSDYQAKLKAKSAEEEKSADGGQVGHIAEVNAVMDATDPANASGGGGKMPRRQGQGAAAPAAADGSAAPDAAAAPTDNLPIIAPAFTLDLAVARIPESKANGTITGTNFVVESARIDAVPTAQVLRLVQGNPASPDREVLVYLHLKPGEKLGGQTLAISQDMRGPTVPQVAKRWKTNPKFAPLLRSYSTGYVLKLELGQLVETNITGKIFVAFPDNEQSVVAGSFKAVVPSVDPNVQMIPVANPTAPTTPTTGQSAMDRRYGVRR